MRLRFPFSRYRCAPAWTKSRRRPRKGRSATIQQLEARELLTATLEIYQGITQLSTWSTLDFGSAAAGATATQTLTVTNGGDESLEVDQPSGISGFSVQGAFPLEIDPGQSASFTVSMDTSNVGNPYGELDLYSNDPNYSISPFTLYLSGTVTGVPALALYDGSTQLSPGGSDSFGTVYVNDSDTKNFTIDNTGTDVLNVNSLSLPSGFYTDTGFPLSVYPGSSASFDVSLYTYGAGQFSGTMTLASDDPTNGSFHVSLDGTVQQPAAPSLTLRDGSTMLTNGSDDSFGTFSVGDTASRTFSLSNSGDANLSVSSIDLPGGFSLAAGTSLPITVPPGQSRTFVVNMNTSSANSYAGTMELDSNDGNNSPLDVNLDGTVNPPPSPDMQLAANWDTLSNGGGYDFGTANVGDGVATDFELSNSGSSLLTISSIALPSGFALASGTSLPITVAPSGTADFTVTMHTSAAAAYSGQMTLRDNDSADGNDPFTVELTGTVLAPTAPSMQVSRGSTTLSNGASVDFDTAVEGTSESQTLTLTNNGTATLNVSSLWLPGGFTSSTSLPLAIAPGQSSPLVISLDTSSAATYSGQATIASDDPQRGQFSLNLQGTVTLPPPVLTLKDGNTVVAADSGTDSLGTTVVGNPIDRTLTIVNSASTAIALTAGSLELPPGFSLQGSFPTSVSANGSVSFVVQLDAAQAGNYFGEAEFSDADPGRSTYSFALSGTVTSPSLTVMDGGTWLATGGSDDFGSTTHGEPLTRTLTLINQGDGPLTLVPTSVLLPAGFSLQGTFPSNLAAGASASVVVELDARAVGSYSGTFSFNDSQPGANPFTITLSGQVVAPAGAISVFDGSTPIADGGSQVSFGTTNANVAVDQTLTIDNTGTAPLTLDTSSVSLPKGYSVVTFFIGSVAPGGSTTLVLALNSAQGGDFSGVASFKTGDPQHPTFSFLVSGHIIPPEPAIEVLDGGSAIGSAMSDSFGTTTIGSPISKTFEIENTGTAPLTLDATSLSLPAGFSLVSPFDNSVAPGASTTLTVELSATSGGDYRGTISFNDNVPGASPFKFDIDGEVLAPSMSVADGSTMLVNGQSKVDLGSTGLRTPLTRTITIDNSGTADLILSASSLSLPRGYSAVSGFATDVPPGESTTLTIQLNATATGTLSGEVSFSDNDPHSSPFAFFVTGNVTSGSIAVFDGPTLLGNGANEDFGATGVGIPLTKTLTIENTGASPLALDPSSLLLPSGFSLVTPFASSVAPGASTQFAIQLDGGSVGTSQGLLSFTDGDPQNSVFTLHLSGQIVAPAMEVRNNGAVLANGSSLSVGTTSVGTPLTADLTVTDTGTQSLLVDVNSLSLPSGFSLAKAPAASVAPGNVTTLVIKLAANAAGSYTGTLSFDTTDPANEPFSITISGTVTAPSIQLSDGAEQLAPGSVEDLGTTAVGTPLETTLTVANAGTASLAIDTARIQLPVGYSLITAPSSTIAPGAASEMVVQLDAAAAGSDSGPLVIPSNDPVEKSYAISLSGVVLADAPTIEVLQGQTQIANGGSLPAVAATVGSTASETLTIDNVGSQALSIDTSSISLPHGFGLLTAPAGSVAPGSSTTMAIGVDTSAAASYSGNLSFNDGDSANSSFSIAISATVTAPAPVLEVLDGTVLLASGTSSLAFGNTAVGSPITENLTISNQGTAPLCLDVSSFSLPTGFAATTLPATVAPGASTTLAVQLAANAAGTCSGNLTFNYGPSGNIDQSSYSLAISGTVVAAAAGLAVYGSNGPIANGSGSDAVGSTNVGNAIYRPYTLENTGTAPLTIDTSSIAVPDGLSIAAVPDSTLAPGATTTLLLRLDAESAGAVSGLVSFNFGDGQNSHEFCYAFNVSGTVTAAGPQDVSIDGFGLPDGLNTIGANQTSADPTVSGTVDGTLNGGSVVVQLAFTTGSGATATTDNASLPAITTSGTSFTFDPRTIDASLANYLGVVDVQYRALVYDAMGNLSVTTGWSDLTFTMVPAPTSSQVDNLRLVNNTGASPDDTYDPRVTATVGGLFVGTSVDVQFQIVTGSDAADAMLGAVTGITTVGATFNYDPTNDDPALLNYSGTVTLNYRTVEHDVSGNIVSQSAWTAFTFTLYAPAVTASVAGLRLADDTNGAATSDATVTGTVVGQTGNDLVQVQFSDHGDGHVDGWVPVTEAGDSFSYDPLSSDPALASYTGTLDFEYRTVEFDVMGGKIAGPWLSFPITLVAADSDATIVDLQLASPLPSGQSGASSDTPATQVPELTGSVSGSSAANVSTVQFQYNGDGSVDQTADVASDGTFSAVLSGLPYGTNTVMVRAVASASVGTEAFGAWTSIEFDYEPQPVPGVTLQVANLTDSANNSTTDATVLARVNVAPASASSPDAPTTATLAVQFDSNGDGVPDATIPLASDGSVSFSPVGLSYGSVTIAARVADYDPKLPTTAYSDWQSITFTYEAPSAPLPQISDLALKNPVAPGQATSDPTITGVVSYTAGASGSGSSSLATGGVPPSPDFVTVQIDLNSDGVADTTTTTTAGGTFSYKPQGLASGNVSIEFRAVGHDASGNKVYGPWSAIAFAYQSPTKNVASVSSLVLANPLMPGGNTATDPTLTGQLSAAEGSGGPEGAPVQGSGTENATAFLTVEFDTNAANETAVGYTPNASAQADANGNFSFRPSGLSYGTVTIAARVRQHDYASGGFDYSAWTTLTFSYQKTAVITPTLSLSLLDDSGPSATDDQTANPAIQGTIGNLGSVGTAGLFVNIEINGDTVTDAIALPDSNGNFIYVPSNLPYGSVTIRARVDCDGPTTYALNAGEWTTISYVYEQQATVAARMVSLGLDDENGNFTPVVSGSPTPTTSQPIVAGQVTWQGDPANVSVEVDTNGDGTADFTAAADRYGRFAIPVSGFTAGKVTVEVRTVAPLPSADGGGLLVGEWTPLTFTYQPPTKPAPQISGLGVASGGGGSATGGMVSDPVISGSVASPGTAGGTYLVQFDTTGSGTADASIVTDSLGNFSWQPQNLTAGSVIVEARAVDYDASGSAIYGNWTPLSFAVATAAPVTRVKSFSVANNVGPSADAPISTDGVVVGQLAGGNVANVPVQVDTSGDGVPDAVVTTDASGYFRYTLPGGPTGQVATVSVRPAPATNSSSGSGTTAATSSASGWASLSFVFSSDPTSQQAVGEAQALASANAAAAAAASTNDQNLSLASDNYQAGQTGAAAGYMTNTSLAQSVADAANAASQNDYNGQVAGARAQFNQQMGAAGTSYSQALATFSGDTTSFSDQGLFVWPDAPTAPPGPDDSANQIPPPVADPSFSGEPFDPTQDPQYESELALNQSNYDSAVSAEGDSIAGRLAIALGKEQGLISQAKNQLQTDLSNANNAYEGQLAKPNPIDMTQVNATLAWYAETLPKYLGLAVDAANMAYVDEYYAALAPHQGDIDKAMGADDTRRQKDAQALNDYNQQTANDSAHYGGIEQNDQSSIDNLQQELEDAQSQLANDQENGDSAAVAADQQTIDNLEQQLTAAQSQWSSDYSAEEQKLADDEREYEGKLADDERDFEITLNTAKADIADAMAVADEERAVEIANSVDSIQKQWYAEQEWAAEQQAQANQWAEDNQATAAEKLAFAQALADYNYNEALADAGQQYNDTAAQLSQEQSDFVADQQQALDRANAQSLSDAAARFAAVENTPWATYQAALAADQLQLTIQSGPQLDHLQHALDADAEGAAIQQDAAARSQAKQDDDIQLQLADQLAGFVEMVQIFDDRFDEQRLVADARAWQADQDFSADADLQYAISVVGADEQATIGEVAASTGYADAGAQIADDAAHGATQQQLQKEEDEAFRSFTAGWARATYIALHGQYTAEGLEAVAKDAAAAQCDAVYADDEWTWAKNREGMANQYETSWSQNGPAGVQVFMALHADEEMKTIAAAQAAQANNDAAAERDYFDALAGFQQTQTLNDALARQTFEVSTAKNYAQAMAGWAATVPDAGRPWANEQAALAAADATWAQQVTDAQVGDLQTVAPAQTAWTKATDLAAFDQTFADVNAWLDAKTGQLNADESRVGNQFLDWQQELQTISGLTSAYDDAVYDAVHTCVVNSAWENFQAQSYMAQLAAHEYDYTCFLWASANEGLITLDELQSLSVQNTNLSLSEQREEAIGCEVGLNQIDAQRVSDIETAKVTWAAQSALTENTYGSEVADTDAQQTDTDAHAAADFLTAQATDEAGFEIHLAEANTTLAQAAAGADETMTDGEAKADAADEVAYAQASATYQDTLWSNYAQKLESLVPSTPSSTPESALAQYMASVASAMSGQVSADETAQVKLVQQVSAQDVTLADGSEGAIDDLAVAIVKAVQQQTMSDAPAVAGAVDKSTHAQADGIAAQAYDQAHYFTETLECEIAYFLANKAQDNADYANQMEAAYAQAEDGNFEIVAAYFGDGVIDDAGDPPPSYEQVNKQLNQMTQAVQLERYGKIAAAEMEEAIWIGAGDTDGGFAEGVDQQTLVHKLGSASDALAQTLAGDDEAFVTAVANASADEAKTLAADEQGWTDAVDPEEADFVSVEGDDEVASAQGIAQAEADYALAGAQIAASASGSGDTVDQPPPADSPDPAAAFQAAYLNAYANWIAALSPTFVADAVAVAQADANDQDALAQAAATADEAGAAANTQFVDADAPAAAEEAIGLATADDGYTASVVLNLDQAANQIAAADTQWLSDTGKADAAYLVGIAQADADHWLQPGIAGVLAEGAKQADTTLGLATGQAAADVTLSNSEAAAQARFAQDDAGSWQAMAGGEAQAIHDFTIADDAATAGENDAAAEASGGLIVAVAAADRDQANADATAEDGFGVAEAGQTVSAWQAILGGWSLAVGVPWLNFEVNQAQLLAQWQGVSAGDDESYISAVGNDEVGYANTDSEQFVNEAKTIDANDQSAADQTADADLLLATTLAGDEAAYETAAATATQGYQQGMATFWYDSTVAAATQYDVMLGGKAGTTAAATALQTAASAAQTAATTNFYTALGLATAQQTSDDADVTLSNAKTVADLALADGKADDLAIDGYSRAESDAFDTEQKNDAQALYNDQSDDANAYAQILGAIDQSTPWGVLAYWQALAESSQALSLAQATLAYSDAQADTQDAQEKSDADAAQQRDDGLAQAAHDWTLAQAGWSHDQASGQAKLDLAFAALGLAPLLFSGGGDSNLPLPPGEGWGGGGNSTGDSTAGISLPLPPIDAAGGGIGGGADWSSPGDGFMVFGVPDTSGLSLYANYDYLDYVDDVSVSGIGDSYAMGSTTTDDPVGPLVASVPMADPVLDPPNPYVAKYHLGEWNFPGDPGGPGGAGGGGDSGGGDSSGGDPTGGGGTGGSMGATGGTGGGGTLEVPSGGTGTSGGQFPSVGAVVVPQVTMAPVNDKQVSDQQQTKDTAGRIPLLGPDGKPIENDWAKLKANDVQAELERIAREDQVAKVGEQIRDVAHAMSVEQNRQERLAMREARQNSPTYAAMSVMFAEVAGFWNSVTFGQSNTLQEMSAFAWQQSGIAGTASAKTGQIASGIAGAAATAALGGALASGTGALHAAGRAIQAAEAVDDAANVAQGTLRAANGDPWGALQAGLGAVGLGGGRVAGKLAGDASSIAAKTDRQLATETMSQLDGGTVDVAAAMRNADTIKAAAPDVEDVADDLLPPKGTGSAGAPGATDGLTGRSNVEADLGAPFPTLPGGTGSAYNELTGQGVYVLKDAEGTIRYVGRGDVHARLTEHAKPGSGKEDLIGEVVFDNNLTAAQARSLEQELMQSLGGPKSVNPNTQLRNEIQGIAESNPDFMELEFAADDELFIEALRRAGLLEN